MSAAQACAGDPIVDGQLLPPVEASVRADRKHNFIVKVLGAIVGPFLGPFK